MSSFEFPIEKGNVMTFARSIGDPNPMYFDEEFARHSEFGRIIAPPTFAVADAQFNPNYALRPQIGQPWFGSGREPFGVEVSNEAPISTGLLAEQNFEYFRPFGPGEVLTITRYEGRSWEREGRRGGAMLFKETYTDYHDPAGELVLRMTTVDVFISQDLKDE